MPGTLRRYKPIKAVSSLSEIKGIEVNSPEPGHLLIYEPDGIWRNGRTITGDLTVTGTVFADTLDVVANGSFGGVVLAAGGVNAPGGIETTSLIATSGEFASLLVTGASTLQGPVTMGDLLTGVAFSFSGNGAVGGTLNVASLVADEITLDEIVGTTLTITGVSSLNTLQVSGNALFLQNVGVSGALATVDLSVAGTLGVGGALAVGSLIIDDFIELYFFDDGNDPPLQEARLYSNKYSVPLVLEGEGLVTPATIDDPPVTEKRVLAYLDPEGSSVLSYGGVPTFRTVLNDIEVWDGTSWGPVVSPPDPNPSIYFVLDDDLDFIIDDNDNVLLDNAP